jgi:hypothetical protein
MAGGEVPVWAAIAVAGISAAGGIAGSIGIALFARSGERARLRQELQLHNASERIEVLEQAIAAASAQREELAAALRLFEKPKPDAGFSSNQRWHWRPEDTWAVKKHEAALKLRFGDELVTKSWEVWEWLLAEAAIFCGSNEDHVKGTGHPPPPSVQDEAHHWRNATRTALESFVMLAAGAVAEATPPPARKPNSNSRT